MARYIDADAFEVSAHERYCAECDNYAGLKCRACWVDDMLGDIYDAPTISPDEVRGAGEWMPAETELGCACSACGINLDEYVHGGEWVSLTKKPSYCPSCGSRMKGTEDGTTDNT